MHVYINKYVYICVLGCMSVLSSFKSKTPVKTFLWHATIDLPSESGLMKYVCGNFVYKAYLQIPKYGVLKGCSLD